MSRRLSEKNIHRSRYGRVSKRKYTDDLIGRSSQMSVNPSHKKKKSTMSSESNSNNITSRMRDGKINVFSMGDMVLAKTGKYPVWPAIITNDPESNMFYKKENNANMFHIHYCNDGYKRNWIKVNQLTEFFNKSSIFEEFPKILTNISRRTIKQKWNRAVDEAECLVLLNKESRISTYFSNNFLPHIEIPLLNYHQVNHLINKDKAETSTSNTVQINNFMENKSKSDAIIQERVLPSLVGSSGVVTTNLLTSHLSDIVSSNLKENNEDNNHNNTSFTEVKPVAVFGNNLPKDHPRILIPELCKLFYANGWVTGTGGGISIKYNDQIFIAPSGVQKEQIEPGDIFVQNMNGTMIEVPISAKKLSISQCTPIFMCSYIKRNAGAVIHIHSPKVVKLCLLSPGNDLRISGLEMIKGIYNEEKRRFYNNNEEIIIPIIENTLYEKDLVDSFKKALIKYPSTSAVAVRNHGIYVWGKDWQSAKTQCECYEYLFDIMVFMKTHNL